MLTVVAGPVRRVAGKDGDVTARASGWTGVFTPPRSRPRTPEPEQALTCLLERAGAPPRGVRPPTFGVQSLTSRNTPGWRRPVSGQNPVFPPSEGERQELDHVMK